MDHNHQSQPLQQLGQPQHSHQTSQQSHPPLPQHQSQPQLLPQVQLQLLQQQQHERQLSHEQQHDQLPHLDATPQDVLAEARKNLQFLIDSGLSKDFLHQWVDNDLSLQLSFHCQQQQPLAQSLAPAVSPTSSVAPTPRQSPLLAHPIPSPAHGQMLSSPSQNSLPLPSPSSSHITSAPTVSHPSPAPSVSGTSITTASPIAAPQTSTTLVSSTTEASHSTATPPTIVIKSEPTLEEASGSWTTPLSQAQTVNPNGPSDAEPPIHIPPPISPLNHRPRISVSSTSSASSGHASIWSVNSAHSSMSWHSASSPRSMAPLPMPPPLTPSSAGALTNNAQSTAANKQNIYWCTSCETSFKRKYDWKRHEDEFHERWRKYPCPEPGCNRSFWGSNSFNQHHKQCHGCKTCPHAEKVVKFLRKRKYWACGFCSALHPARERHVEHVARHFESGLSKGDWMHSRVIYGLLHQPLIHGAWDALMTSKHGDDTARRPQFSWHPSKTGRAQGFLEKESPGQLQDLLEFFPGDNAEAQWIVTVAYDLADIVLTTPTPPPLTLPSHPPPLAAAAAAPPPPATAAAPSHSQHFTPNAMIPPPHFQQQQDHHMSFPSVPPVPPQNLQQGMMTSPASNTPSPFSSSPYRSHIYIPSSGFASMQQASPEAIAQSPLVPSQAHQKERDLPPPPPQTNGSAVGGDMMAFEYSRVPVSYQDWESLANATMLDASQLPQQQQQQTPDRGPQDDWEMSQYLNDPRVAL